MWKVTESSDSSRTGARISIQQRAVLNGCNDATTIDLCLSVFPWVKFRKNKAGMKLNVAMSHKGKLPEFVSVSNANEHEIKAGRDVDFPKGSIVAVDRGYTNYEWYKTLTDKGI